MNVAIPDVMWERFQTMTTKQFGAWLVDTAKNVEGLLPARG